MFGRLSRESSHLRFVTNERTKDILRHQVNQKAKIGFQKETKQLLSSAADAGNDHYLISISNRTIQLRAYPLGIALGANYLVGRMEFPV